ncbi:Cro/Cl family transcriptional regulator [Gilliamella sp. Nev5-1]|uniref:transcriptional regulator n=1 Tax=unclassified Gilliamella TaxID=2685620 RepID=UPI00080DE07D|nr:Cro/CI family transcriptional regulator [Gilliamella apicola]OCG56968.1 Cro/Cl family transcriptional regulator [Gilliamella apicola]OCG71137.1 Cro/Cl family transcriptional regulator [Gilliamella apicola]
MLPIQRAFKILGNEKGRGGISRLAKHFGITSWAVSRWQYVAVPAERCPDIEFLTDGQVTCEELRPDVNWSVIRGRA